MKLIDVLQKECIVAGKTVKDKNEALLYVAQTAKKAGEIHDEEPK